MVFLHDALSQGKSQSPSALFGGVAGAEHVADVARGDAFAGVGDFDYYVRTALEYVQVYATGSCHGVDGVFAEVLDDPFKKRVKNGAKRGCAKSIVSIFFDLWVKMVFFREKTTYSFSSE